mgnify:CR=1 FL=1
MKLKTICFDIDNVICTTKLNNKYHESKPIKKNINLINKLYDKGFIIILYTARYMGRCNGDIKKVKKLVKPLTLKQLRVWKVKYHNIYFGKPSFDLFIDDKSLFFKKNWSKLLREKLKI